MNNSKNYDVIVVGGGIAGLVAAASVSRKNKTVMLIEKEPVVGGLVGGFQKQNFTFDCGIRALENAGTLIPMLENFGIDAKLEKSSVMLRIFEKTVTISDDDGLLNYSKVLKHYFPENKKDIDKIIVVIQKTMCNMDVLYGVENPLFSPLYETPEKLLKTLVPWLCRYLVTVAKINMAKSPVRDTLLKLTDNTALVDVISQHFFTGSPVFFALGYFWLYKDYYYPKNSISSVSQSLKNYIEQNGGEVICGVLASKIDTTKKQLFLSSGEKKSFKKLIWCCSKKALINSICSENPKTQNKRIMQIIRQRGSDSILTFYIALNIPPKTIEKTIGSHLFFTPSISGLSSIETPNNNDDIDELFRYTKSYLSQTTFEISCPAVKNKNLAPNQKSAIIVGTLFSYDITEKIKSIGFYDKFKEFCKAQIAEILDKSLIKDFKSSIIFCEVSTPLSIEKRTGNDDGAITGWRHTSRPLPAVSGFTAIANSVNTDYPNIFQAGMWTFSPAGLPVSIITGRLAADKAVLNIDKERLNK